MATGGDLEKIKLTIHDALVNDSSIAASVLGRVFTHHLSDADATQIEYPMIVTAFRSGRMNYSSSVQADVMECWTYSRTSAGDATKLYKRVKEVLQAERLLIATLGVVVVCQEIERPNEGWNETTRSWWAQGRWLVRSIG